VQALAQWAQREPPADVLAPKWEPPAEQTMPQEIGLVEIVDSTAPPAAPPKPRHRSREPGPDSAPPSSAPKRPAADGTVKPKPVPDVRASTSLGRPASARPRPC